MLEKTHNWTDVILLGCALVVTLAVAAWSSKKPKLPDRVDLRVNSEEAVQTAVQSANFG